MPVNVALVGGGKFWMLHRHMGKGGAFGRSLSEILPYR